MEGLFNWLAEIVSGALAFVVGWQIKLNRALARDISDHRLHVAESYVTKSDLRDIMSKIERTLERIENKIDRKVDK